MTPPAPTRSQKSRAMKPASPGAISNPWPSSARFAKSAPQPNRAAMGRRTRTRHPPPPRAASPPQTRFPRRQPIPKRRLPRKIARAPRSQKTQKLTKQTQSHNRDKSHNRDQSHNQDQTREQRNKTVSEPARSRSLIARSNPRNGICSASRPESNPRTFAYTMRLSKAVRGAPTPYPRSNKRPSQRTGAGSLTRIRPKSGCPG
jgi:hypothetical protein